MPASVRMIKRENYNNHRPVRSLCVDKNLPGSGQYVDMKYTM